MSTAGQYLTAPAHLVNSSIRMSQEGAVGLTDAELLGFINQAFRDVITRLGERGVNALRVESEQTLLAGETILSDAAGTLPAGFVQPLRLWSRATGTTNWSPLTMAPDHLPFNATQTTGLGFWEYRNGTIRFPGATVDTDIRIHYIGNLVDLLMPGDVVGVPDLVNAVTRCRVASERTPNSCSDAQIRSRDRIASASVTRPAYSAARTPTA